MLLFLHKQNMGTYYISMDNASSLLFNITALWRYVLHTTELIPLSRGFSLATNLSKQCHRLTLEPFPHPRDKLIGSHWFLPPKPLAPTNPHSISTGLPGMQVTEKAADTRWGLWLASLGKEATVLKTAVWASIHSFPWLFHTLYRNIMYFIWPFISS